MKEPVITKVFGVPVGTWVWCLHCERCYQVGEYREIDNLQMCPYPDCDGDTVFDAWRWSQVQSINKDYPEIPEREKVYPQFQ